MATKSYMGTAEAFVEGVSLGFTLKSKPFNIKTEVTKIQVKTDYSSDIWVERETGSKVTAELSLPYTEENLTKFPNNMIVDGSFRATWLNKELEVRIPKSSITFTHVIDAKSDSINYIKAEILALENGNEEKIEIDNETTPSTPEDNLRIKGLAMSKADFLSHQSDRKDSKAGSGFNGTLEVI